MITEALYLQVSNFASIRKRKACLIKVDFLWMEFLRKLKQAKVVDDGDVLSSSAILKFLLHSFGLAEFSISILTKDELLIQYHFV